jgi:hypothetical protein
MLNPPPAGGKTLRKRKTDNSADRLHAGFGTTSDAATRPQKQSSTCRVDQAPPSSIKAELALWRAFLGDEIDAILRDKD